MFRSSQTNLLFQELESFKVNCNKSGFLSALMNKVPKENNADRSKAKPGQRILITNLNKNVLFVVLTYLKCDEIYALLKSSEKIHRKISADPFFKQVASDAFSAFFF